MKEPDSYSVASYLGLVNKSLVALRAVVHGEVTSVDFRGNYLFFKLKDDFDESILPCFMWMRSYEASGVPLVEGMKVAALGVPEIFKARGSFSFQAAQLKEAGEGVLKKRYDELKKKLELEGLFSPERKRPLPSLPERIGLVTSATGAVIHDFRNNLRKRGIKIVFHDTRVEGQFAEGDIVRALRHFHSAEVELVVVIRGGGSLEALASFNSEAVVREIASLPVPVISGIGHDKDVPLATLAADFSVSTPTAAAELINRLFDAYELELAGSERSLRENADAVLFRARESVFLSSQALQEHAGRFFEQGRRVEARFMAAVEKFQRQISSYGAFASDSREKIIRGYESFARQIAAKTSQLGSLLEARDPERVLALGYSIIRGKAGVIRSIGDARVGDSVALQVSDGTMEAQITELSWQRKKDSRKT